MQRPRRIRVHETKHYVKFKLADEMGASGAAPRDTEMIRRRIEMHPPLLAWVARARMLAAR
jgi:hypothetical protein